MTPSRGLSRQYAAQGRSEAQAVKDAFQKNADAAKAGGQAAAAGTKTAYGDVTDATNTGANMFGGVLGGHKLTLAEKQRLLFDTQKDTMIARREVLRNITRQSYDLLKQENSHGTNTVLVPELRQDATRISDAVVDMHEKIRAAITRQAELTRAAIRAQTTTLNAAASGGGIGATADAGPDLGSTSMQFASPFAPAVGAFAADGPPDYTSATGQVRAYAAATGSLLDLFGDTRSLRLSTMQERALTLNFNFSSLTAALSAPVMMLERAANLQWEASKLNINAVQEFRDAVDSFGTKANRGTYEMARRPTRKKL